MGEQLPLGYGRVTQRYILLIDQLADDYAKLKKKPAGEKPWGWQTWVAGKLRVDQSYVWRVINSGLQPSTDIIELACKYVPVSEAFFFGHFQSEPDYRDFGPVVRMPDMGYPALRRFYESDGFGLFPTEQERHVLGRQEWEGEPTERTYDLFLQAIRSVKMATVTAIRSKQQGPKAKDGKPDPEAPKAD